MKDIPITVDLFKKDFPKLYKQFIKELEFSQGSFDIKDLFFYYQWSIVPLFEDDTETINMEYNKHTLTFEERLEYEASRIGIDVYVSYKNYIRGHILEDLEKLPDIITEDLTRYVIQTMRYEQNFYLDKKIISTIPKDIEIYTEIDNLLTPLLNENTTEEFNNLDDILDKINKYGLDALTDNEIKILDNLSKK